MAVDLDPNALARTIGELRGLIRELQGKDAIMRAWTQQRGRAWVVYWNDPDGNQRQKACGTGRPGKMLAEKERRRLDAELVTDTYEQKLNKSWADFRQDYETVLAGMSAKAREQAAASLANFERIAKPSKVSKITTHTIDKFTSERRQEKARYTRKERLTRKRAAPYRDPPVVSPATVNADLRNIKAALRIAADWDYIKVVPKVRQLKEPERLPTYVPPTDFEKLYAACESARLPRCQGYTAADWWRAFLMTAALTGWRIGELIGLPRTAFDLAGGFAKVWNEKAKREELFPLHPSVIEHLRTSLTVRRRSHFVLGPHSRPLAFA